MLYLVSVLPVIITLHKSCWILGLSDQIKHTVLQEPNAIKLSMQGHLKPLEISWNGAKTAVILPQNVTVKLLL